MDEALLPPPRMSWENVIASLPDDEQNDFIHAIEDDHAGVFSDWFLKARREQLEPDGDWWTFWLIMAGRGFGKNWSGSNWLIDEHRIGGGTNSAIIAATSSDLRKYCIYGPSGILANAPPDFMPIYQPSKTQLVWPNETVTQLFTSEKPDRLRGPNLDRVWCDELAAWRDPEGVMDMLRLCLRYGDHPKGVITTTPRPIPAVRHLLSEEGQTVVVTRGATMDNQTNLAPKFINEILKMYKGTRLERQEIYGEVLDDFEGALWDHDMIEACRTEKHPALNRIVIGVDPQTEVVGETGIVAAGKCDHNRGYVLGDHSISGTPEQWAKKAVDAYYAHGANAIIAETNQGGQMVESVIHNYDPTVPVIKVRASVGKVARAEPCSMLYEQSRVDHVGSFPKLEDEMCIMVPGELKESPNRVDGLVWALTELLVKPNQGRAGTWGRKRKKVA